jgi:glutamate transport system substrate-binding protein
VTSSSSSPPTRSTTSASPRWTSPVRTCWPTRTSSSAPTTTRFKSPADLNNKKLCSVTGSTSAQNVKDKLAPKAKLQTYGGYSECLTGLENKVIDALTTDDSILAGYAAQDAFKGKFKLAGFKMSNENYGIGLKKGDTELKDKINKALEKMVQDKSWDKAVEAHFGPAGYKNEPAPKIGNIVK